MKINGNTLRPGMLINHQNRLWTITKTQHVKPGKGGAFMQVEMKDIQSGTKLHERFRADETIERVRLDEDTYQFLFAEGDQYTFMHTETFDQIQVTEDQIGEASAFLQDGMIVTVSSHEGKILSILLPETVVMEISEAEPVVKGQTASASYKPAILTNGVRVMVPPHIDSGMRVVINTQDGSYVERAKD